MWVGGGGGGDIPSCQHSFLSALLSPEPVGGFRPNLDRHIIWMGKRHG